MSVPTATSTVASLGGISNESPRGHYPRVTATVCQQPFVKAIRLQADAGPRGLLNGCDAPTARARLGAVQCVLPSDGQCQVLARKRDSSAGVSTVGGWPRWRHLQPLQPVPQEAAGVASNRGYDPTSANTRITLATLCILRTNAATSRASFQFGSLGDCHSQRDAGCHKY